MVQVTSALVTESKHDAFIARKEWFAMAVAGPVAICDPHMTLREALNTMQERRIGSLVVTGHDNQFLGLITHASLAEAMLLADATRTLALNKGIGVQNTTDRLAALVRAGIFTESFSASVVDTLVADIWR